MGHDQIEEERRTLYVAITRSQELLFLSHPEGYSYITGNERFPSRFIKELDEDFYQKVNSELFLKIPKFVDGHDRNRISNQTGGNFYLNKNMASSAVPNLWKVNDTVEHDLFGIGVVVKIIAQNVQIVFPKPFEVKIISADSHAIKKVE